MNRLHRSAIDVHREARQMRARAMGLYFSRLVHALSMRVQHSFVFTQLREAA